MTVNIVDGFEQIHKIMKCCIETEMTNNGLLSDVETFIPIYYNEEGVEEPCVWMVQHPTTVSRQADITQTIDLITPFEFDCVVYESDLVDANEAGQNLANRVILSILRNYLTVQSTVTNGKRLIKRIDLQTYYPVGEVNVQGKSDRVPATGVVLNVVHTVNWTMCCRQILQDNQSQSQETEEVENNG